MKTLTVALLILAGALGATTASQAIGITIDFDALTPGQSASSIATPFGNLLLTTTATHYDDALNQLSSLPIVSSGLETTSPSNYLGADGGGSAIEQQFLGGDRVVLDLSGLSAEITGVSAHFVTNFNRYPLEGPFVEYPSDLFLIASSAGQAGSTTPGFLYGDGGKDFFVRLTVGAPISSAELLSSAGTGQTDSEGIFYPDLYSFTIDDITLTTVPEPGSLLLAGTGCLILAATRRPRRRGR